MKIIHCADLHLGSKMDNRYPAQKAQSRRQELRNAFIRLTEEAEKIGAKAVLISGDAFDSDHPSEKDLEYFYEVIASHSNINFYYLRGNHDLDGYGPNEPLDNLFTVSSKEWTTYSLDDEKVTISGIEITKDNVNTYYTADGLKTNSNYYNIAMLHGQTGPEINLKKLSHRGFHYLALGHIHSYKIEEMEDKCIAAYAGTLEPRGFDEIGEKGFVVIDTAKRESSFKVFNQRTIHWERLDITGFKSELEVSNAAKELLKNQHDLYRIELVGEKAPGVHIKIGNIASRCKTYCFLLDVIDRTSRIQSVKEIDVNTPLIKEFVAKIESDDSLAGDERAEAIQIGLNALAGKEF